MMQIFSNFIFLNPWILSGLLVLPALWFLLRITPPAPRLVALPTVRFLAGLIPETQTPDKTPWWILLLRLLIAALIIIALARPVHNPAEGLPGTGAIRLVIDNGWAAAQTWDKQIDAAVETLSQAARGERQIYILTTTSVAGSENPASFGSLSHAEASAIVKALKPLPWPADYKRAAALAADPPSPGNIQSLWFSHGLDEGEFSVLASLLQKQGGLTYIAPPPEKLPLLLKLPAQSDYNLEIAVVAPTAIPAGLPVTIQAMSEDGRVLDRQAVTLDPKTLPLTVRFNIPETLRGEVSRFRLTGHSGVGGIFILDDQFRKRAVGLVSPEETDSKPFIEAGYYLKRALEPYTTLHTGRIDDVIASDPSVIILPDIGAMPPENLTALEEWVRGGGLLLRFAGPNMTKDQNSAFLVPVPLRRALRSTEGSLSWENPPKLKEFVPTGPLSGLPITGEIAVRQQILSEPTADLETKTWARLDDGTPLITAAPLDDGMLVMVHTTASPDWSDLALSGTYVEILRRLVSISGKSPASLTQNSEVMQPLWVFDGFGVTQNPDSTVRPIPAAEFSKIIPGPSNPPGLYGSAGIQQALNLGTHVHSLSTPKILPMGAIQKTYGKKYERDLMPYILYAAMALLLFDWLVMIIMVTELRVLARFTAIALILFSLPAHAQNATEAADGLYLAYIVTGDSALDSLSHQGLKNLSATLSRRTSAEPVGVMGLNPETDMLAFFPLIYWPISANQSPLSAQALNNIQFYLDHGGTILFDTRDRSAANSRNGDILRAMTGALNIPPLAPINKDHVLARSFYLLDSFPGRYDGGTLWVETTSVTGRDGVSSVIVGANDWAGAWAAAAAQHGATRQEEMANRFGVNLVIYALTGNYKADQVHVPHILERLGQ